MISKLLIPLLIAVQLPAWAEEEEEEKNNSILSKVPIGATSTNVTIPSFDEFQKRASLFTANVVVVDSAKKLSAEGLVLRLFDKKEKINASGTVDSAEFLSEQELLLADGKVHFKSTDGAFEIKSKGGIFKLPTRQGIFLGPGLTLFTDPPKKNTAMNLHPLFPLAIGLQILVAAPPPELTAEELSQFERLVAPRLTPPSNAAQLQEQADFANAELTLRLARFLSSVDKLDLILQVEAPVPTAAANPDLNAELKEGQTSIEFDNGAYFDGDTLEMVYLGNISLKRTNFSMTCNKDLKVILDEPVEKKDEKKEEKKATLNGLGELKQLTASGKIVVKGVDDKGNAIEIRGDRALYDKANQSLLIRGDNLFFKTGDTWAQAMQKDAYVSAKFDGKRIKNARLEKQWKFLITDPDKKK